MGQLEFSRLMFLGYWICLLVAKISWRNIILSNHCSWDSSWVPWLAITTYLIVVWFPFVRNSVIDNSPIRVIIRWNCWWSYTNSFLSTKKESYFFKELLIPHTHTHSEPTQQPSPLFYTCLLNENDIKTIESRHFDRKAHKTVHILIGKTRESGY